MRFLLFAIVAAFLFLPKLSIAQHGTSSASEIMQEAMQTATKENKKIFIIFQRLHNREEYSGTGIGLAICKKIIDNHHGFIRAESKEGQGSAFIIFLPKEQKEKTKVSTNGNGSTIKDHSTITN